MNFLKLFLIVSAILLFTGCSTMQNMTKPSNSNGSILLVPPAPKKSTCEKGKIETIVLGEDGTAKIWYYSGNSFLSLDFKSNVNVRITRATDNDFCYDYF